jgi:hypothetical protein
MKIAKPKAEIASDKINIVITMPMCVSFHLFFIMSKSTPKKTGPAVFSTLRTGHPRVNLF